MSVNTDGMNRFLAALPVEMRKAADIAGLRVLTQWRTDFNRNSRGGGDWAPLALATVRARRAAARGNKTVGSAKQRRARKGKKIVLTVRTHAILVNTGLLRGSLQVGNPGNIYADIVGEHLAGKRVGIGGDYTPAQKRVKGRIMPAGITLGELARIHNDGKGHNPRRVIAQPLTQETADACNKAFDGAIQKSGRA